jgi:hypothetical protein
MNIVETKVCRGCAETIKAAARVCPFCQSRQGRFKYWSLDLGLLALAAIYIGLLIVFTAKLFPEEKNRIELTFGRYRSDLGVDRVAWDRPTSKPEFWLSGFVTNKADRPWRIHELEVSLLDDGGNARDVRHLAIREPFVVHSGQEHAFRACFGSVIETSQLSRCRVRVRLGSNGTRPFEAD